MKPLSGRAAIGLGIAVGLVALAVSYRLLAQWDHLAGDYTLQWRAAQRLLAGLDPYRDPSLGGGRPYPFDTQFNYPLPAALIAIPLSGLPPYWAGAIFCGTSSGLLAFALARRGEWHRFPLFLTPGFGMAAMLAQWSPMMLAAAFLPGLLPLLIAKPQLGLPMLLWNRNRWGLLAALLFGGLSLAVYPAWPLLWLGSIGPGTSGGISAHRPAVLLPLGSLLGLAILAWRTREARLLLWMAAVPQLPFFYDQLMLWLIPRTWRQSGLLVATGWLGFGLWAAFNHTPKGKLAVAAAAPYVLVFFYLPALALVLWQAWRDGALLLQGRLLRPEGEAVGALASSNG